MTRQEFIDRVTDFYELVEFCNENGCDICEDLYDDDGLDECVEDDLRNAAGEDSWRNIRDWLGDIPTGYDWYCREGYFDYRGVDYDFDEYKENVLNWADDEDIWDDEDEEDEEDLDEEDDDDFEVEEDVSMDDMVKACFEQTSEHMAQVETERQKLNESFAELCQGSVNLS